MLTTEDIEGVVGALVTQMVPGDCVDVGHGEVPPDTLPPYVLVDDMGAVPIQSFGDGEVAEMTVLRVTTVTTMTATETWQQAAARLHTRVLAILKDSSLSIGSFTISNISRIQREPHTEQVVNSGIIYYSLGFKWELCLTPD